MENVPPPDRDAREDAALGLVPRPARGRLKIYVGSAAGVGKTYRMLQEAHDLRRRGVDVVIAAIETHGRRETLAQCGDLEQVPLRTITYRGVSLHELDLEAVIARRPQVALVDELAHSNVPGVTHPKRWEDVLALLEAGISVISAVNVQHVESLNRLVEQTLGVVVRETVPDWMLARADQVVSIDLPADELRQRLLDGKIYAPEKVRTALDHFFTEENLTALRELALREVASSVDREREEIVRRETGRPARSTRSADRIMVAMASHPTRTAALLHKASRIAGRLNTDWYCVYVQTSDERADRIDAARQRQLVDNIQLAERMGAEYVKLAGDDIADTLCQFAVDHGVALLLVGPSHRTWWQRWRRPSVVEALVRNRFGLDVLVVTHAGDSAPVALSAARRTDAPE
jgi:two-component system sensor histidine kinase KdpD